MTNTQEVVKELVETFRQVLNVVDEETTSLIERFSALARAESVLEHYHDLVPPSMMITSQGDYSVIEYKAFKETQKYYRIQEGDVLTWLNKSTNEIVKDVNVLVRLEDHYQEIVK